MNKLAVLLTAAIFPVGAFAAAAQPAAVPAVPGIDPAATALWAEHAGGMGGSGSDETKVDFDKVLGKALEFFRRYPDERRVGGIIVNLSSFSEWVRERKGPGLSAGWQQYLRTHLEPELKNPEWPDRIWEGLLWVTAKNEASIQFDTGQPDLALIRAKADGLAARVPAGAYRVAVESLYLKLLDRFTPAESDAFLQKLRPNPNEKVAALARGELAIRALKQTPMELQFTALDGREVDLAKLRGKVVFIDCWATWCVPCVKELPHVKAAYAKYRDQGFEVIGISFDKVPDRAKLGSFVADQALVWPHYFNEKGGTNFFGERYNLRSIPATFLLDRDGRLVTTDTRGEKLEQEIRRLLRL
ncbi:MAG: TlpA family protein disulfide reductase [Opitutus sp.]|nr:TlpA family protein disulfide reductase [Opitutus sp.]